MLWNENAGRCRKRCASVSNSLGQENSVCPTQWDKHMMDEGKVEQSLKSYGSLSHCWEPQHALPRGARSCCSLRQSHGEADGARIPQWKLIALLLVSFSGRALVCSHHPVINTRMSNWPCGGTLWGSREEWQDCAFCWDCGFLLEWSSCVTMAWEVSSKGLSRNQQSILRFYFQRGDGV